MIKEGVTILFERIDNKAMIYGMIFSLSNRVQKLGDGAFEDLTIKQHFLLVSMEVYDHAPNLSELAELIGCSYQNIKSMAKTLERKGFIEIKTDPDDRRKVLVASTGKFEAESKKHQAISQDFMKELYRGINPEDMLITLNTLIKMNQNLGGAIPEQ